MPQEGFETRIPVFERANTVHALDRAATVIGQRLTDYTEFLQIGYGRLLLKVVGHFVFSAIGLLIHNKAWFK
jgi:hypothetical protein